MSPGDKRGKVQSETAEEVDSLIAEDFSHGAHHLGYGTLSHDCDAVSSDNYEETVVYKRRWYILLIFSALCMLQNGVWNTWNPLSHSVQIAFDWDLSDLALLSNWGSITYIISMPFFSWMMDVKGLRWSCVITSALITVGCAMRCITSDPATAKWLIHGGQILNGFAGPVTMAAVSLVSSVWFPAHQRTTATAISLLSGNLGVSLSFIIGPELVSFFAHSNCTKLQNMSSEIASEGCNGSDPSEVYSTRNAIMLLMYSEFAFSCLLFLLTLVYFPAKPPSAPSVTAAVVRQDFQTGIRQLLKNATFWKISLCFAIAGGVSGNWFSFVDPIMKNALTFCESDSQYNEVETGWLGFFGSIAFGVCGCIVAGIADSYSRHMKLILAGFFTVALLASVGFSVDSACYVKVSKAFLFAMYIVCGIGVQGCAPIFYELCCETTYPIAEGLTSGVVTWLANLVSLIFLVILMIFPGTLWMNWATVGSIAVCIPIILSLRDNYNRLDVDDPCPQNNGDGLYTGVLNNPGALSTGVLNAGVLA